MLLWVGLLALVAYIPLFYRLASPAVFIWDEAIYANNAFEMILHGNWWVPTNNGEPTTYNIKPPLVLWMQALWIKMLGPTEWALRLPSAIAAFLTVLGLFVFARRNLSVPVGGLAAGILLTSPGFVRLHVARTGDPDAVLVFFITAYTLTLFEYLSRQQTRDQVYWALMGLLVFGAFMAKSIAGLMPLPGLALAMLSLPKGRKALGQRLPWISAGIVLILVAAYYLLREWKQPGYFQLVWTTEVARYGLNVMPWHEQGFGFYLENMATWFFPYYLGLLPLALLGLGRGQIPERNITQLCLISTLTYFLLISTSTIKLQWYDAPLYPLLSLLLGIGLVRLYQYIQTRRAKPVFPSRAGMVLGTMLLVYPYFQIYRQNRSSLPVDPLEWEGYTIRHLAKIHPEYRSYKVLMKVQHDPHLDQARFYVKKYRQTRGYALTIETDLTGMMPGDTVLCAQSQTLEQLAEKFSLDTLFDGSPAYLVTLTSLP